MYPADLSVNCTVMGGVPCVRHLRIPVATVLRLLAGGLTETQILSEYPDLEPGDIRECLRFAADVLAVIQAEDAENRLARRELAWRLMSEMDPQLFPVMVGAFSGPDTVPGELIDHRPGRERPVPRERRHALTAAPGLVSSQAADRLAIPLAAG